MRIESTKTRAWTAAFALLLPFVVWGSSPAPAICQEGEGDEVECEVDKVTLEGGMVCMHGLDCGDVTAEKLCYKLPELPG